LTTFFCHCRSFPKISKMFWKSGL